MGTVFTVRAYPGSGMDAGDAERICGEALACAAHWEKVMSAMDAESGLARLNAAEYGISVPVSPELERVLLLALDYARLTNGAFDPTLGPCIRLWKKSRRLGILPSGEERECALRACGWEKLSVRKGMAVKAVSGMRLDLGGMGKGFALDRMAEMLKTRGVCSFFMDSTSDVLAGAPPPGEPGWRLRVDTGNGQGGSVAVEPCGRFHLRERPSDGEDWREIVFPCSRSPVWIGCYGREAGKRPGAFRRAGGCPGDGRVCDV